MFNNHTLVDFDRVLLSDSKEINRLQNEFESNGWCFIRLPNGYDQLTNKLKEVQTVLSAFFAQSQEVKSRYESSNAIGYSHVDHKEGIKVLIDQNGLGNFHNRLTSDVEQALQYLAILIHNLTNVLKTIIFNMSLFRQNSSDHLVELSGLGMLDIVNYFNKKAGPQHQPKIGLNTNEVNCVPHFDPGLFSLSILSTCEGLQLYDQLQDKWIDGPNNSEIEQNAIGVIWLGEAASILTKNCFKCGIHRVVYPQVMHKSRLTIWQEICTKAQIDPLISKKHISISIPNKNTNIKMTNRSNYSPMKTQSGGETMNSVMIPIENERGISPSNATPRHLKMSYNNNSNINTNKYNDSDDDDEDEDEDEEDGNNKNNDSNKNGHDTQRKSKDNRLPGGASVIMRNQPNSVPFEIKPTGETMNNFLKRVENERGLSISKSGIEHIEIKFPVRKNAKSDQPKKKRSFLSKILK
ncbi:unnamed protein product [Rotaria socialis]|uniref:Uncharacterized protein n=1 Tax=Rotaria socialis TaxID=392032 RepID=A0A820LD61_9BILA|nr:unnamed protein product [Rotaria socialis]CAF4354512.1 unnamed protein product [Rotaria socialis]